MADSTNSADHEEAPDREPDRRPSPPSPSPRRRRLRIRRSRVRRRRPARLTPPTQAELDAIPADRRLELQDLAHRRRHRRFSTWVLTAGVLATAGTLLVTALTLRSGQEQLNLARQGQITDRYAKAAEQTRQVAQDAILRGVVLLRQRPRQRHRISH